MIVTRSVSDDMTYSLAYASGYDALGTKAQKVPALSIRPQTAPAEGVVGTVVSRLFSNALATLVMRSRLAAILPLGVLLGFAGEVHLPSQPAPICYDNPVLLRVTNHELVWDGVVDVVSDYFRIDREDPVRLLGNTLTEGRIDTFRKPGATLLEPWDHDSADTYQRLESTLQSIRRYAIVKVIPAQNGGFWIDVAVYKELENVRHRNTPRRARPPSATTSRPTHRSAVNPRSAHQPQCSSGFPRVATRSPSSGSSARSSTASRPRERPSR